jgi:membrane protein YqaA with SNARE-associated domain
VYANLKTFVIEVWHWLERRMQSPYAPVFLFLYSFVETLVTLLPIDPFALAVMIANKKRVYSTAIYIVTGSLLGAVAGFWIGREAFDWFAPALLGSDAHAKTFLHFQEIFRNNDFLITFTTAFVPIPKTPTILAAGFLNMPMAPYVIAWGLGRTLHFAAEALIVRMSFEGSLSYGMRALTVLSLIFAFGACGYIVLSVAGLW